MVVLCFPSVPTVQFEESAYTIHEPTSHDNVQVLTVVVVKTGDLNSSSTVRCSTRDGSAHSGLDYRPKSHLIEFKAGKFMWSLHCGLVGLF